MDADRAALLAELLAEQAASEDTSDPAPDPAGAVAEVAEAVVESVVPAVTALADRAVDQASLRASEVELLAERRVSELVDQLREKDALIAQLTASQVPAVVVENSGTDPDDDPGTVEIPPVVEPPVPDPEPEPEHFFFRRRGGNR